MYLMTGSRFTYGDFFLKRHFRWDLRPTHPYKWVPGALCCKVVEAPGWPFNSKINDAWSCIASPPCSVIKHRDNFTVYLWWNVMAYSELDFSGVAVCCHINVSFETVFLVFKVPVLALRSSSLTIRGCRGGGDAKRPGVRLTTHHLLVRKPDVKNEWSSTSILPRSSWHAQGQLYLHLFILVKLTLEPDCLE
jgi:hypothetical protein